MPATRNKHIKYCSAAAIGQLRRNLQRRPKRRVRPRLHATSRHLCQAIRLPCFQFPFISPLLFSTYRLPTLLILSSARGNQQHKSFTIQHTNTSPKRHRIAPLRSSPIRTFLSTLFLSAPFPSTIFSTYLSAREHSSVSPVPVATALAYLRRGAYR